MGLAELANLAGNWVTGQFHFGTHADRGPAKILL